MSGLDDLKMQSAIARAVYPTGLWHGYGTARAFAAELMKALRYKSLHVAKGKEPKPAA